MSTALRDHYLRLKRSFPDALLLFRLGNVYEQYDEDARVVARELGIPLVVRKFALGEHIPMCPIPYHAIEGHIRRLVTRGYKIAIAEQIGEPRVTQEIVEREVVRIITPSSTLGDQRRQPSDHSRATAAVEQSSGVAVSPSPQGAAAPSLADTPRRLPLGDGDAPTSASDKWLGNGFTIQLPLFSTPAEPSAMEPASATTDDYGDAKLGLF